MRTSRSGERGSVTAELAVALPALVALLYFGIFAVQAVTTKLRCVDAAREAALAAARGGGEEAGEVPEGASVEVTVAGDRAVATVRVTVRPFGGRLPGVSVAGTAVAAVEPGVSGPAS